MMPKKWLIAASEELESGKKSDPEKYEHLLEAQVELYELAEKHGFDPELIARSAHEKRAADQQ